MLGNLEFRTLRVCGFDYFPRGDTIGINVARNVHGFIGCCYMVYSLEVRHSELACVTNEDAREILSKFNFLSWRVSKSGGSWKWQQYGSILDRVSKSVLEKVVW